jgi:hypothetical protein
MNMDAKREEFDEDHADCVKTPGLGTSSATPRGSSSTNSDRAGIRARECYKRAAFPGPKTQWLRGALQASGFERRSLTVAGAAQASHLFPV